MKNPENPFVGIGASIVALFIAIVALVVIFANAHTWILGPIAGAFAFMGICLGYFASKKK